MLSWDYYDNIRCASFFFLSNWILFQTIKHKLSIFSMMVFCNKERISKTVACSKKGANMGQWHEFRTNIARPYLNKHKKIKCTTCIHERAMHIVHLQFYQKWVINTRKISYVI